jgi:hypothetical protein
MGFVVTVNFASGSPRGIRLTESHKRNRYAPLTVINDSSPSNPSRLLYVLYVRIFV